MTLSAYSASRKTGASALPLQRARSYTGELRSLALRARRGETLTEDNLAHLAALVAGRTWPEWNHVSAQEHCYKRVQCEREWPAHTAVEGYERSIRRVILDPHSDIFLSVARTAEMPEPEYVLTFMGESRPEERGEHGKHYIVVVYSLDAGCWRTAYQTHEDPDEYLERKQALGVVKEVVWL